MRARIALMGLCAWLGLAGITGCSGPEATDPAYVAEVDAWHAERLENLRSDTGWLTLVGLHELDPGLQIVGSAYEAHVRLIGQAPERIGYLEVGELGIVFEADPTAEVFALIDEKPIPVSRLLLATDASGKATVLACGSLVFHVIERGDRFFLRVKDRESETLTSFEGIERFPVEARWRIPARLEGDEGTIEVPNVLGQSTQEPTPGVLVFEFDGKKHRVSPTGQRGERLFLVFADETTGHATYGGGRFLSIDEPDSLGQYTLDFNRATNPPCVFTAFATCPMPSLENQLKLAVEAGEKMWGEAH